MEENKNTTPNQEQEKNGSSLLNFQFIYTTLILNWKWFVLSLIICLGVAAIYLRYTPPIYQAYADYNDLMDVTEGICCQAAKDVLGTTALTYEGTEIDLSKIRRVSRDERAHDEALLRAIYRLLHQAHYRTSPDDLKHLLDLPGQSLYIATRGADVAGVLHLRHESPLPEALAAAVIRGERRPQGRLLLQQLLTHSQNPAYNPRPLSKHIRFPVNGSTKATEHASSFSGLA